MHMMIVRAIHMIILIPIMTTLGHINHTHGRVECLIKIFMKIMHLE
jgi:hypothetical protein